MFSRPFTNLILLVLVTQLANPITAFAQPETQASTDSSTTTTTLADSENSLAAKPNPTSGAIAPKKVPVTETLPQNWLEQGLQLYQKGSYPEAERLLTTAIAQQPNEGRAYYNLGLVEFKLNHSGAAIARWRQALDHSPHFPHAREALRYAQSQVGSLEAADFSPLWSTHTSLLNEVSLSFVLLIEALLLLVCGTLFIRRLKAKRSREKTGGATRNISLTIVFILLTLVSILKVWDKATDWGTVVVKKASARSTSSEDSATLFEIAEGQEVIILRTLNGWYEIQMPSEKVGWLAPESIMPTAGE